MTGFYRCAGLHLHRHPHHDCAFNGAVYLCDSPQELSAAEAALAWYARGADLGSAEAAYSAGWAVWRGLGVSAPNRTLAAQLFTRWVLLWCAFLV